MKPYEIRFPSGRAITRALLYTVPATPFIVALGMGGVNEIGDLGIAFVLIWIIAFCWGIALCLMIHLLFVLFLPFLRNNIDLHNPVTWILTVIPGTASLISALINMQDYGAEGRQFGLIFFGITLIGTGIMIDGMFRKLKELAPEATDPLPGEEIF